MKNRYLKLFIFLIFIPILASPVYAQGDLDPDEWKSSPNDPRSYEQVKEKFQKSLADYDYPSVFLFLQKDLEGSPLWIKDEPVYQHLLKAFLVLNERFSHFKKDLAIASPGEKALEEFLNQYPTGLFQFPCLNRVCFKEDYTVSYDDLESLLDPKAEDFLYRVETVNHLMADFKRSALEKTVEAIRDADKRWEIFINEGMSQYPWEAVFNGLVIGAGTIQFPPTRQWILIHPELGIEVSTNAIKDLKAKEALGIELIGHIWYRWRDRDDPSKGLQWWGISAVASLRDDIRSGIGFMVHYGRFLTLGITWHDDDGDSRWFNRAPYFIMGIDLFRFAEHRVPNIKSDGKKP